MKTIAWRLLFLSLWIATGCGRTTLESVRQEVVAARDKAKQACKDQEPKRAIKAAAAADTGLKKGRKLAKAQKMAEADSAKFIGELTQLSREARRYARLADQEDQRRQCLASLKVRTYARLRSGLCSTAFKAFEEITGRAAKNGFASLSPLDQEAAKVALAFSDFMGSRAPLADGSTDWAKVSSDMKAWSANLPPELGLLLAIGFAGATWEDLAVFEIEGVDAQKMTAIGKGVVATDVAFAVTDIEIADLCHVVRIIIYHQQGWNELAIREAEQGSLKDPEAGRALIFIRLLVQIGCCIRAKDSEEADRLLAQTIQLYPDHPLTAFLTGEMLAANGEYVKAAESLEKEAANAKHEWLARRLAARARKIRDPQADAEALILDKTFLLEALTYCLAESAKDSKAMQKMNDATKGARDFAQRIGRSFSQQ